MSVHSVRFGRTATLGTGTVTLYTVPAQKRSILKSVVVSNNAAAANHLQLLAVNAGGTTLWTMNVYVLAAGTDGDTVILLPWIVMNNGDLLKATGGASSLSIVASGAELDL